MNNKHKLPESYMTLLSEAAMSFLDDSFFRAV